jgi:hypothetical protein
MDILSCNIVDPKLLVPESMQPEFSDDCSSMLFATVNNDGSGVWLLNWLSSGCDLGVSGK